MKQMILLFLALFAVMALSACAPNYSNGTRAGTITKLSERGLIFKSWEGEMVSGGTAGESGGVYAFNVDPDQVDEVQAAMVLGIPVEVVYRQWLVGPPTIDNSNVVTGIKQRGTPDIAGTATNK